VKSSLGMSGIERINYGFFEIDTEKSLAKIIRTWLDFVIIFGHDARSYLSVAGNVAGQAWDARKTKNHPQ
jgi:hypothetical protein